MARVNLVADAKQAATEIQHFFAEGDPGPIPGSLALVPDLMAAALPFMARTLGPSAIAHRTKEVVILRASHKLRCRYCTDTHTAVALGVGLSKNEVAALRGERSINEANRISRYMFRPDKYAGNPIMVADRPWEEGRYEGKTGDVELVGQTVLYDEEDGIFKMWYLPSSFARPAEQTLVVRSPS